MPAGDSNLLIRATKLWREGPPFAILSLPYALPLFAFHHSIFCFVVVFFY